ncbi:hypothetical protein [Dokdonella soli]|uniref:Carboxypeptidase regulatory-like domain-containing protein n=1 Tax=Dokdonella soli TaxID=529810 RepID=A0ABN1IMB9_9GAMM
MIRFALALALSIPAFSALAATDDCKVTGTAYDAAGRPLRGAVVRLVDLQTRQAAFLDADTHAAFAFDRVASAGVSRYRLDVLSPPTVVTGSHIPTRSVLGMSPTFACESGNLAHQDVRVQID